MILMPCNVSTALFSFATFSTWHDVAIIISASCVVRGSVKPLNPWHCHSQLHATRSECSVTLLKLLLLLSHIHMNLLTSTCTPTSISISTKRKWERELLLMSFSCPSALSSYSLVPFISLFATLSVCLFMLLTYLPLPAYQATYVCHVPVTGSANGIESKSEMKSELESESVLPSPTARYYLLTLAALCNEQQQCNLIQL